MGKYIKYVSISLESIRSRFEQVFGGETLLGRLSSENALFAQVLFLVLVVAVGGGLTTGS